MSTNWHVHVALNQARAEGHAAGYEAAVRDFWRAVTLRDVDADKRSLDVALWLADQSRDAARKARLPEDVEMFERGARAHNARAVQLRKSIDERERWAREDA